MASTRPRVVRTRLSPDERRHLLIEATLVCLARDGAEGASLRSVCREAGVAPSLVDHFFDGWHGLLIAAYQHMVDRFMAQLTPAVAAAGEDAEAAMNAVIRRYLSTDWIGPHTVGANIALWHLSRGVTALRPHFTRFLRTRNRVMRLALLRLAEARRARIDAADLTTCFTLMLDGIWLEMSVNPGSLTNTRAMRMCHVWLDAVMAPRKRGG